MKIERKVLLVTWSHVDLAFLDILKKNAGNKIEIEKFEHVKGWNSTSRSYIKNYIHIIKFAFKILWKSYSKHCIYFGHNLCRMFFLFSFINRSSYYIYNELPKTDDSILCKFDKLIFKLSKRNFVSNHSRLNLLKAKGFETQNTKVIENVTFSSIETNIKKEKNDKAIIIGTFSENRFGESTIRGINSLKYASLEIDALPSYIDRKFNKKAISVNWLKGVPHNQVNKIINNYSYGILAYENSSLNNFYAAPLKIYEYVNFGLKIISIIPNNGIDLIKKDYPELFVNTDLNSLSLERKFESYEDARLNFLRNAIETNQQFANIIMSI